MPFERRYQENHGTNTVHSQPVSLIGTELKILAFNRFLCGGGLK